MKSLKKEINEQVKKHLSQYGFQTKKYSIQVRIKDNVVQTIGLGFAHGGRCVTILIGVLYQDINAILLKLGGYDSMKTYNGMVGTNIGYLMPGNFYKEWIFRKEDTLDMIESIVKDMMNAIIQYGFPYLDELSDKSFLLDKLLDLNSEDKYMCPNRDKLIPVLYHLRGEDALAMDYIKKAIQKEGEWPSKEEMEKLLSMGDIVIIGNQSVSMNDYLAFARNFKKFIEAGH